MALSRLDVPTWPRGPLPERVRTFLADADARIDRFLDEYRDNPASGFVPSDYAVVYRALAWLRGSSGGAALLPGKSLCEWGSGLGVVACLASMLGFDAVGIEIDPRLVAASHVLATDYSIAVEFVQGSYIPDDHDLGDPAGSDEHVVMTETGRAAYEELGLDPDDFDCIFAYPWPGEDPGVSAIFDRYAARGAVLMTFHGQDGLLFRRKVR
jgi:hypothetical protein